MSQMKRRSERAAERRQGEIADLTHVLKHDVDEQVVQALKRLHVSTEVEELIEIRKNLTKMATLLQASVERRMGALRELIQEKVVLDQEKPGLVEENAKLRAKASELQADIERLKAASPPAGASEGDESDDDTFFGSNIRSAIAALRGR